MPALREAIFEHQRSWYGLEPEDLLVTFGATEAMAAAMLGLCDPGDEVIVLEPYYDSSRRRSRWPAPSPAGDAAPAGVRAGCRRAGAAVAPRTRMLLLNTPHNPTGRVLHAQS